METVLIIVVIITGLLLLGYVYEKASASRDKSKYPPPGERVDIGGRYLHFHCMGDSGPAVIFEAGIGGAGSLTWGLVQAEVAKFARACVYDRAGYNWSDDAPGRRTAGHLADDLYKLLQASEIPAPYILVGHGFASLHLRKFTEQHPELVVGMVFVDCTHPDMRTYDPAQSEINRIRRVQRFKRFGLLRFVLPRTSRSVQGIPDDKKAVHIAMTLRNVDVVLNEAIPLLEDDYDLPNSIGDIPLVVISRSPVEESERSMERHRLQEDMLKLSSDSRHIITETGSHYPHLEEPQVVIDAIRYVAEKARVR